MSASAETVRLPDNIDLRPVQSVLYWANRFGERGNEDNPGYPGDAEVDQLVELLYPQNGDGIETAHLVTLDGVLGLALEFEFDDGYKPDPAVAAHWRIAAPEGCRYLCYSGHGSFDDRWQFVAFVPVETATRGLVEQCGDALYSWGCKA